MTNCFDFYEKCIKLIIYRIDYHNDNTFFIHRDYDILSEMIDRFYKNPGEVGNQIPDTMEEIKEFAEFIYKSIKLYPVTFPLEIEDGARKRKYHIDESYYHEKCKSYKKITSEKVLPVLKKAMKKILIGSMNDDDEKKLIKEEVSKIDDIYMWKHLSNFVETFLYDDLVFFQKGMKQDMLLVEAFTSLEEWTSNEIDKFPTLGVYGNIQIEDNYVLRSIPDVIVYRQFLDNPESPFDEWRKRIQNAENGCERRILVDIFLESQFIKILDTKTEMPLVEAIVQLKPSKLLRLNSDSEKKLYHELVYHDQLLKMNKIAQFRGIPACLEKYFE